MSSTLGTSESVLRGYVDDYRRPLIRLFLYNLGKHVLALVDTGFTKEFLMEENIAHYAGLESTGVVRPGVLASGRIKYFTVWRAEIGWLGSKRQVEVDVPVLDDDDDEPINRDSAEPDWDRQPTAIVGTQLMSLCRLQINFVDRVLQIREALD